MGKFQLHSLTKPRFGELWKLLALFSLRITGVAKAYDFGSRKGKFAKDVDSHCHHMRRRNRKDGS